MLTEPVNTTIIVVYDTVHSYSSTAGLGPFNASLVAPFIKQLNSLSPGYPFQVLPFSVYAVVYNLMANPWFSTVLQPIECPDSRHCESYLLSGGALLMEPWIPPGYESWPLIKVDNVPAMQLEYAPITSPSHENVFSDSECQVFGENGVLIAIRFCVAPSASLPGVLNAGLFVCRNGTSASRAGLTCNQTTAGTFPNITTSFSMHARTATLTLAQSNLSIVSVSDLSPPTPFLLPTSDLEAYRMGIAFLLNFTAAGIPPPSSIAESFWSAGDTVLQTSGQLMHSFQSILAFPVWMFNANNYGNLDIWDHDTGSLPSSFRTRASIVTPYSKIKFDGVMVVVYTVLQGATLLVLWGLLAWACWSYVRGMGLYSAGDASELAISSYLLFDIAFKSMVKVGMEGKEIWRAEDADVERLMGSEKIYVKME